MEGHGECQQNEPNAVVNQVETEVRVVEAEQHDHLTNTNTDDNTNANAYSSERRGRQYWLMPRRMFGRFHIPISSFSSNEVAKEAWGCTIVILTFWLFGTMILMLGFYGSYNVQLGPNCSYALGANPFFAHSIKAQVDGQGAGLILYGFHKSPSLDVETTWSKTKIASIDSGYHREWKYNLNAGSNISIYYDVKIPSFDPLSIIISQGREALVEWMDDPFYPNTTLSWNIIHGSGRITQNILETDVYYVAIGNMNVNAVKVYLNITIQSQLYNTTNADFECYLSNAGCSFKLKLLETNVVVLSTPGSSQAGEDRGFFIQISFATQWLTYCSATCIVAAIVLAVFQCCDKSEADITHNSENQARENVTEPLISPKGSSNGSSYESASNDEDEIEEKIPKVEGSKGKIDSRCAICFDAPKDCFFLPCGHSAACFTCGSRIAEEAGSCPICRRKMKKVRKIFLA